MKPTSLRWTLFTDGSGHQDGYGGYGAVAYSPILGYQLPLCGARNSTTVNRMELTAVLEGLNAILSTEMRCGSSLELLEAARPVVLWVTDRQNIAMAATKGPDGNWLNSRKTDPDLWAQFEWFERRFQILALQIARNSREEQAYCDSLAGVGRATVKQMKAQLEKLKLKTQKTADAVSTRKSKSDAGEENGETGGGSPTGSPEDNGGSPGGKRSSTRNRAVDEMYQ